MLKSFLKNFPDYYIQTFDDKAVDKSLTTHGKPESYKPGVLPSLNQKGAGIFFTPNRFKTIRRKDKCDGVNAWVVEMDNMTKEDQWKRIMESPLNPSIIVETRKSYHCYFLAKNGTIENYDRIVRGLIQFFDGDPACKDISRVFRIPGFYHNKQEPFMVKIKFDDYSIAYTEEEMLKWFPFKEDEKKYLSCPVTPTRAGLNFWEIASKLDNRMMLQKLSGKPISNFESITFRKRTTGGDYIDVNGKPSDAWIDENGMIGSGKGGGPTYLQWLTFYGWNKSDIAKWLKEDCKDLFPEEIFNQSKIVNSSTINSNDLDMDELLNRKSNLTWGNSILDNNFSPLDSGRYIILVGETGVGKTAWAFHLAKKNADLGNKVLYLSLEMSNEGLLARYARNKMRISKQDWKDKKFDKDVFKKIIQELPATLILKNIKQDDINVDLEFIEKIISEKYDMVFIDNFGFIEAKGETTNDQMKNISKAMVRLKNKTGTTIVALHHFRKGGEKSSKLRNLDSILGSGKIGHDVDFAVQVTRDMDLNEDAFESEKAKFSVIMMKDRDFGDLSLQNIYYKNGEFYSSYH